MGQLTKKAPSLPQPLSEFVLDTPEATIRLRLQMTIKAVENEEIRISGAGIRSFIPATIPRRVEKVESLKGYILVSSDSAKFFLFATREAASDFVQQRGEGRAAQAQALESHRKAKAEAEAELVLTMKKLDALRSHLHRAYEGFMEGSLAAVKAEGDAVGLEARIRDLKQKIARPEPEQSMGLAIATMFGCDEIITEAQIVEAVTVERAALLKRFRGLPDESTLHLGRRLVLAIAWKQPN